MNVAEKIYPGNVPRPTPLVINDQEAGLLLIATPWGGRAQVEKAMKMLFDYYVLSKTDNEATSPLPRLPGLTPAANSLRIGTLLANENIYEQCNKNEFSQASELLAISKVDRELIWIQAGQPHLFLFRNGNLLPLSISVDLSVDFNSTIPLPGKLLGIDRQVEIETKSINVQPGDRIIVLSRTSVPLSLLTLDLGQTKEDELCSALFNVVVRTDPAQPFWIAVIDP